MDTLENNREKNIDIILAIIKFGTLVFGAVITSYENLMKSDSSATGLSSDALIVIYGIFVPLMLIIYWCWNYLYMKSRYIKYSNIVFMIENCVFAAFCSIFVVFSTTHSSQTKLLFLFLVVSSVIQLGSKLGMISALFSSFIILTTDLIFVSDKDLVNCFQNDLILVSSFILVAWCLGNYVMFQKENITKKDEELHMLNMKLTEQNLQRKYIESIISKNEDCYNLLINNSSDAVFVHRNNKLIFANESAAKLIGTELMELIDKSILDFASDNEKESINYKYSNIYKSKSSIISFEQGFITANGMETAVENTSARFIYEGKPTILTILHDISNKKQIEVLQKDAEKNIELLNETREFNKLITEFFSNISHELKTPLNIIFSSVQLLESYNETSKNKLMQNKDKYLSIMRQNCYRLMRLINNLLDITRADSGFLKASMKNYNIVSLVEDITMSVVPFSESKGINLIFDTDCEELVMAVDPDKIERIILNLLSNSLKFTCHDGQVLVTISDTKDYVTISIKDNGIGIPENKQQLIFERFRQVDRTFTRNHEGTGIGLSLVKTFVEMHQGAIEVKSKLGEGSEFIIRLPIRLCDNDYKDENYVDDSIIERISIEFSDIYGWS